MMTTITHYHIIIIIIIISFQLPIYNCPSARQDRTVHRCHPRATDERYRSRERWPPAVRTAPCRPRLLGRTAPVIGRRRPGTLTGWPVSAVDMNIAFIYSIIATLRITSAVSIYITVSSSSSNNRMWYKLCSHLASLQPILYVIYVTYLLRIFVRRRTPMSTLLY